VLRVLLWSGTVLSVLACTDATSPRRSQLQPQLRRDVGTPDQDYALFPLSAAHLGHSITGPTYPARTLVEVTWSGGFGRVAVNPCGGGGDSVSCGGSGHSYALGGDAGSCAGKSDLQPGNSGLPNLSEHTCPTPQSGYLELDNAGSTLVLTDGGDQITFTDPLTGTFDGYSYIGSTSVHVARAPANPTLTSADNVVLSGDTAYFVAAISPETTATIQIPRSVNWRWQPDDPTASSGTMTCQYFQEFCTFLPPTSGTMWWGGLVNGDSDSVGKHVDVVPCLRTDSTPRLTDVLNSSSVRQALDSIWTASNPSASDPADRKEQGAVIYLDTATNRVFAQPVIQSTNTPCTSNTPFDTTFYPGTIIVGMVHTHPYHIGDQVPDSTATNGCPAGTNYYQIDGRTGALSALDWNIPNGPDHVPAYVLDFDNLFRGDPNTTTDQEANPIYSHPIPRTVSGCSLY
jgi:hypothetical protein